MTFPRACGWLWMMFADVVRHRLPIRWHLRDINPWLFGGLGDLVLNLDIVKTISSLPMLSGDG